ncbi:unnamed protein product [Closterium sp. NIES-65]|nr:unnamed protein product [Closterium sp. NIES-65]
MSIRRLRYSFLPLPTSPSPPPSFYPSARSGVVGAAREGHAAALTVWWGQHERAMLLPSLYNDTQDRTALIQSEFATIQSLVHASPLPFPPPLLPFLSVEDRRHPSPTPALFPVSPPHHSTIPPPLLPFSPPIPPPGSHPSPTPAFVPPEPDLRPVLPCLLARYGM